MCTKHFGRNFITTVGTVARLIQSGQVKQSYLKLFPGKREARSVKNCKLENMEHVRAVFERSPNRFV